MTHVFWDLKLLCGTMWKTVSVKYFKKKNPNRIAVSIIQDPASSKRPVNTTGSSHRHCTSCTCAGQCVLRADITAGRSIKNTYRSSLVSHESTLTVLQIKPVSVIGVQEEDIANSQS